MASKTCASCLRTLHRQPRSIAQVFSNAPSIKSILTISQKASGLSASRAFTTTASRHLELNPGPNTTPRTSVRPVDPVRAEGEPKIGKPMPASIKAAAGLKRVAGRTTETYTAYGATEILYKECSLQADYSIPQAGKDDQEMPKTEAGEDLGVGEGWWLKGKPSGAIKWI